ncbi:MAG: hypothetical protein KGI37_04485 [Alphaproteobacteria bacterium]|nr:hypothetical protein [Alphaproteobacteria bacterium]
MMLILGHRGRIYGDVSQNSLKAYAEAVAEGDGFECDAVLSRDGEIFLIHEAKYVHADKGVEYCMGEYLEADSAARLGSRRIDELCADEVRALRLKDGQGLPTLREALALVGAQPGKLIDIELKAFDIVEPVVDMVAQTVRDGIIARESVMLSSFNHPSLLAVRKRMPEIKVGAIFVGPDQPTTPLFPWQPRSGASYVSLTQVELESPLVKEINPDVIVMPEECLMPDMAAMIAGVFPDAELAAWVFTEKGNFDLQAFLLRLQTLPSGRVMAMMVDHPGAFRAAWHA